MPLTMAQRYRARLTAIGIPYYPNRNNRDHAMYFVPVKVEEVVNRTQRAGRIKNPVQMLTTYWEDRRKCFQRFEENADVVTQLQMSNFDYYVIKSLDPVLLFLIARIGSAEAAITALQEALPISEELDRELVTNIVRVSAIYI